MLLPKSKCLLWSLMQRWRRRGWFHWDGHCHHHPGNPSTATKQPCHHTVGLSPDWRSHTRARASMCRHVGWQSVRKRTDLSQKPARRNQSLQLPVCQRIFKENVVFSFGFFYVFNTCWPEFVATMGVKDFRRIIFPCYEVHQLSTFIAGKTIAVDGSVLEHAIMADKEIAGLRQGSGSFFAEVFQYLNTWYTNKNLGCAKAIVWVFDADVDGTARLARHFRNSALMKKGL